MNLDIKSGEVPASDEPQPQTAFVVSFWNWKAAALSAAGRAPIFLVATLSHGQAVNKAQWIGTIQASPIKYDYFQASDIKIRVFQSTAIATCLWSSRFTVKGKHVYSQLRSIHVYINTPNGWRVISGQNTNLPPDVQQPL